ncbi:MAG: tetratricopeptide repeat protein [Gemmatimonadaceae bacterium]
MSDQIRKLSDDLARDPSSQSFLPLGDALRRSGQLDLALKVGLRGIERHPKSLDGYELIARISVDLGDMPRAMRAWETVLSLAPWHVGARKGLGYLLFKAGRLEEAENHLKEAAGLDDQDPSISKALAMVRRHLSDKQQNVDPAANGKRSPVMEARFLFADILGDGELTALLVDAHGLAVAGAYVTEDSQDVTENVAAALSGMRSEVERTIRHLSVGDWIGLTVETDVATVAMAPAAEECLVMVAAAKWEPLGFVGRTVSLCVERAESWLRKAAAA